MSTRTCDVCGGMYDEKFCPVCYGRFTDGIPQFEELPEKLKPFFDEAIGKVEGWDYEKHWKPVEKIRRRLYRELNSKEAHRGSAADQEEFRKAAKERAAREVDAIIQKALPDLQSTQKLFDPVPNNQSVNDFRL